MALRGDDVAWEESDLTERIWRHSLFEEPMLRAIGQFIAKHRQGVPTELCEPRAGGFNALFRMKFIDGGSAVIRFTKPGSTMFPEEKIKTEVATMRFIQDHTAIPVPFVHHWGTQDESPLNIGSFIIMEYVNHEMDMIDALNIPGLSHNDRPILNPNINVATLEILYGKVAKILLQLSKLELPLIGALEETEQWSWEITRRPLSLPMNELVRVGTVSRDKLPITTFNSSSKYLESLATLHLDHLSQQRNDAVESRADCQRNYAAPNEFTFAPPWWLLLEQPEYWKEGLDNWIQNYEHRLTVFLKAMVDCEDTAIASGKLQEGQRLSCKMRESWANGDFWTVYAARKNFAFDCVYWKKLDARLFGLDGRNTNTPPEDVWMKRFGLLDEHARVAMESFVDKKMAETETRALAWDPDEYTLTQQARLP